MIAVNSHLCDCIVTTRQHITPPYCFNTDTYQAILETNSCMTSDCPDLPYQDELSSQPSPPLEVLARPRPETRLQRVPLHLLFRPRTDTLHGLSRHRFARSTGTRGPRRPVRPTRLSCAGSRGSQQSKGRRCTAVSQPSLSL